MAVDNMYTLMKMLTKADTYDLATDIIVAERVPRFAIRNYLMSMGEYSIEEPHRTRLLQEYMWATMDDEKWTQ